MNWSTYSHGTTSLSACTWFPVMTDSVSEISYLISGLSCIRRDENSPSETLSCTTSMTHLHQSESFRICNFSVSRFFLHFSFTDLWIAYITQLVTAFVNVCPSLTLLLVLFCNFWTMHLKVEQGRDKSQKTYPRSNFQFLEYKVLTNVLRIPDFRIHTLLW